MTYEYDKDTRQAYRNVDKARAYRNLQFRDLGWGRFASWREKRIVKKALAGCALPPGARVLDVPCGTGILGGIFRDFPHPVVAADISLEMMNLARPEYGFPQFLGLVQADITRAPFAPGDFACVITLGLMHRLPAAIRQQVLAEIASLTSRYLIISYSIDSPIQRLKQEIIKKTKPSHRSAPAPAPHGDIVREVQAAGLRILQTCYPAPLLSSEIILVLEKHS